MDTTPFTEEAIQKAGMVADKKFTLPKVECAKHALEELMKEWSGTTIIAKYEGKGMKRKMLQFKPKFEFKFNTKFKSKSKSKFKFECKLRLRVSFEVKVVY